MAPPSSQIALHSDSHKLSILSKFNQLRIQDLFCDVTIEVENSHFKAHKALLAASSGYFSNLLTSQQQTRVTVYNIAVEIISGVLDFVYSGQISIEEKHLEQLLAAARRLEVKDLINELVEVVRKRQNVETSDKFTTRKRGRPRKSVPQTEEEHGIEEAKREGERSKKDADAGIACEQQSKRLIKLPLKYKSYTLGQEESKTHNQVKRGRKRKYPNTDAKCDQCGKVFKNHLFLKIHQRTHTGEKPFRCSDCGHGFTQKHSLIVHQRAHTGERPFVCSVCDKALCTKHSLLEHMKLHENKKPFSCDKCERTFTQKRQLKSHYRVHSEKSLPECAECHRKFLDTAQLKKHLRTHTGEKPFTCEICGKCFTTKSTLQTHIRIHKGEKPYECQFCQKCFSDPSARRRHVATHSGLKPYSCSSCNLTFTRLDNLKSHTKTHTKEPPQPSSQDIPAESILQLQPFSNGAEEIQLVVTGDNLNFVQGQDQSITLVTQNLPSLAVVSQGDPIPEQAEQMHVITLSKEAMEQLQALPDVQGLQQGAAEAGQPQQEQEHAGQAIHISSQSGQAISISQTSQQLSGNHIQGQTFQIQAGTVSYLYTTGLPHD